MMVMSSAIWICSLLLAVQCKPAPRRSLQQNSANALGGAVDYPFGGAGYSFASGLTATTSAGGTLSPTSSTGTASGTGQGGPAQDSTSIAAAVNTQGGAGAVTNASNNGDGTADTSVDAATDSSESTVQATADVVGQDGQVFGVGETYFGDSTTYGTAYATGEDPYLTLDQITTENSASSFGLVEGTGGVVVNSAAG